jgi:riboflavin synthase
MFTGIVEELGTVGPTVGPPEGSAEGLADRHRLRLLATLVTKDAKVGDSIAVNGCCLTVVALDGGPAPGWWEADVSAETLLRTTLGTLGPGDRVNLERPVRLQDRLGGHLVQGHVDAVGEIVEPAPDLRVRMPADLVRYVVAKGSITVDGISLTVVDPLDDGFTVALIPHTTAVTTLGHKDAGATVNLEVDVMAKYAERLLTGYPMTAAGPTVVPAVVDPPEPYEPAPTPTPPRLA